MSSGCSPNPDRLCASAISLGHWTSDGPLSQRKTFSWCPIWTSLNVASFYFLVPCCWSSEADQHLLLCFLLEEVAGCDEDTPQPPFLQTEQAKCPQLLLRGLVFETFCNLGHAPPPEHCNSLMSLHWGIPNCPQCSRPHQVRAEWENQLAVLCLVYPSLWLALFAARALCWLISSHTHSQQCMLFIWQNFVKKMKICKF